MNGDYHHFTYWQVGLAALLILINGAISVALKLGLEWRLLLASARMIAQLLLVGLVLDYVFQAENWLLAVGLAIVMVVVAGVAAVGRNEHPYPGVLLNSIVSIWASSWVVMAIALTLIIPVQPWYSPHYTVPLLGMILGNTLSGISLGLDRMGQELTSNRNQVEALLAMGATRWEAAQGAIRKTLRTGMMPTLNMMTVAGIVSLPGMMTGQILSGVSPFDAVKYQIVILFLVAAGSALGTLSIALLTYRKLFNRRHQFLYERMK